MTLTTQSLPWMADTATRLNFACGSIVAGAGFENSDIGHDGIRHVDLTEFPYPYRDDTAEIIMISHGLRMAPGGVPVHPDIGRIIGEFHRILIAGGWLRIDDNPRRCYADDDQSAPDEFPQELRCRRSDFVQQIRDIGFIRVEEIPTGETLIPCDEETRAAILGNSYLHLSYTIEAQK